MTQNPQPYINLLDLRNKILAGVSPTSEEMRAVLDDLRKGRRAAEKPEKKTKAKKGDNIITAVDLSDFSSPGEKEDV